MPTSLTDRLATISDADIRWMNAVRIIAGQYPPIVGFERIGAPDEFDALLALERETQPRVAASDATMSHLTFPRRATGRGAGFVMPAFTRISPDGSRFAPPGSFGVYYAGLDEATAVEETIYHTERVAAATGEADQLFMRRVLVADIVAMLADFRGQQDAFPDVYDLDNYSVGQAAGRLYYQREHDGIVYDSVRDPGGECVAVFNLSCVRECRHAKFLAYHWNGERIVTVYDMKEHPARRPRR